MPGKTPESAVLPALLTLGMIREHFIPLAPRTLHRWISSGQFPRADVAHGGKVRLWRRATVEAWVSRLTESVPFVGPLPRGDQ